MEPELSAILIVGRLRERAARSLRHLLDQTILPRMEIVVADLEPTLELPGATGHPAVRHLRLPHQESYWGAEAAGVRAARAPIVALIEDHAYASPEWAEAVLEAFEDPRAGAVNYTFTAPSGGYVSRSVLMAEYGFWMAPHPGGEVEIAASANIAYRRDLLLRHLEADESVLEADFLIHRVLRAEGWRITVAPRATVAHESWERVWDACLANGAGRRSLGARRAALENWGTGRRLLMAAAMAAMPALGLFRLARSLRRRPRLWGTYLAALPVTASIYTYIAGCEALGYLFGPGRSREEFRARAVAIERNA